MSPATKNAETSDANGIQIASWSLKDPASSDSTESMLKLEYKNEDPGGEAIFLEDTRRVVKSEDIRPGGKYRNIIKLFIRYEGNTTSEAMGTGWLIAPDVLVTAGHCVFDWNFPLERAVSIRAYMGYNGKASLKTPNVIYRYATQAATTVRWLAAKGTKSGDFAVLKLNKPFDLRVPPVNFKATPMKGAGVLGVVGYPGDKSFIEEPGAQMYEMFLPTHYDRNKSENHMLDYLVSTYGGQSGSPVLLNEHGKYTAIGVHTYGGRAVNSATVLDKDNNVAAYRAFCVQEMWKRLKATVPPGMPTGVSVYTISGTETVIIPGSQDTESFLDVFKSVLKVALPVASTVVSAGAPLMGPIGAVVASLAGVALQATSKLTESAFVNATESHISSALDGNGAVHRAILCEAAIHALGRLDDNALHDSGALATMSQVYAAHADRVKKLTPHLSKALLEPSLRIAMDQLRIAHNPAPAPGRSSQLKKRVPISGAESFLVGTESALGESSDATSFVRDMITGDAEVVSESFFGSMLDVLKKGVILATPLVTGLARKGLDRLDQAVTPKSGTESGFIENPQSVLDMLPKRALVGEAALQAVMKLPKQYLHAQYPKPGSDVETEGLIDVMRNIIQKIGPRVIAAAPVVCKTVTPIIKELLQRNAASEALAANGARPTSKQPTSKQKRLEPTNGNVKHGNGEDTVKGSEEDNHAANGDENDIDEGV